MDTASGTGIMLLAAALLWFLYLVPTWLRRREYLATERNATRLQQTLRIMAETAETPEVVRVEARAREVAEQERVLRRERAQREREMRARLRRESAERRAAERATRGEAQRAEGKGDAMNVSGLAAARRRRIRRSRLIATLLVLAAVVTGGAQLWAGAGAGAGAGMTASSWVLLAASAAAAVLGVSLLRALARSESGSSTAPVRTVHDQGVRDFVEPVEAPEAAPWTPVAVPKPLYLGHSVPAARSSRAQPGAGALDAETEAARRAIRDAAERSERALREAHRAPEVAPLQAESPSAAEGEPARVESGDNGEGVSASPPPPSRFAKMGIVDLAGMPATPDLDEALRRRRNAG